MLHEIGHNRAQEGSGEGSWVADRVVGVASRWVSSPWWAGGLVAEAGVPCPGEQADDFGKGRGRDGVTRPVHRNWLPQPS